MVFCLELASRLPHGFGIACIVDGPHHICLRPVFSACCLAAGTTFSFIRHTRVCVSPWSCLLQAARAALTLTFCRRVANAPRCAAALARMPSRLTSAGFLAIRGAGHQSMSPARLFWYPNGWPTLLTARLSFWHLSPSQCPDLRVFLESAPRLFICKACRVSGRPGLGAAALCLEA